MPAATPAHVVNAFADALAAKDFDRIRELLTPDVDFRALTPNRFWEARGPDAVVREVLEEWLRADAHIDRMRQVELDHVGDRGRVGYRFEGRDEKGPFVLEQQAYFEERDGQLSWLRVLSSGRRRPA